MHRCTLQSAMAAGADVSKSSQNHSAASTELASSVDRSHMASTAADDDQLRHGHDTAPGSDLCSSSGNATSDTPLAADTLVPSASSQAGHERQHLASQQQTSPSSAFAPLDAEALLRPCTHPVKEDQATQDGSLAMQPSASSVHQQQGSSQSNLKNGPRDRAVHQNESKHRSTIESLLQSSVPWPACDYEALASRAGTALILSWA